MSKLPEYKLEHVFAAPRDLVWQAWTDPQLLQQWYGPNVETIIHKFELKVGGLWLNEMKWGENSSYQKVIFEEIIAPEKLVWQHFSSTDAHWNSIANPMMPDWPHLLLTTVTFTLIEAQDTRDAKTHVCLRQIPLNATTAEINCFAKAMSNMDKGWGAGYAIIEKILIELQANEDK